MTSLSKLSIAAGCRPGEKDPDGATKTERHFWDFLIDGTPLRSAWQDSGSVVSESVGVLGWGVVESDIESVAKLQGEAQPDYPPNRIAIYACPECGDLGCGAVTVAVKHEVGAVTWSDFRWEVNWYADHSDESTIRFELGPFRFDSDAYTDVLGRALKLRPKVGTQKIMWEMKDTNPSLHIPGVLKALEDRSLPHRVIAAQSEEDKGLTEWTEKQFPWGFAQIDWMRVSSHSRVKWTSLEDLVSLFRKMTGTLNPKCLVVVMWANGLCPVLEMLLGDIRDIATEIFEEHETSTNVLVFSRSEGWLIEMHHEGTLCFGRPNSSAALV